MEPTVSTLEIIPAEVSGYCDVGTGECATTGPGVSDSAATALTASDADAADHRRLRRFAP
jgi:hypothetical protein